MEMFWDLKPVSRPPWSLWWHRHSVEASASAEMRRSIGERDGLCLEAHMVYGLRTRKKCIVSAGLESIAAENCTS